MEKKKKGDASFAVSLISLKQHDCKLLKAELFWTKQKHTDPGGSWGAGLAVSHCKPYTEGGERIGCDLWLSVCSHGGLWDGRAERLPVHFCSVATWSKLLVRTLCQQARAGSGFPWRRGIQERRKGKSMWKTQTHMKSYPNAQLLTMVLSEPLRF